MALFAILLVVHSALVLADRGVFALGVVAVIVGAAAVLAIGFVYWLRSQPAWRHWSTLVSLFGGLLTGWTATTRVVAFAWPDSLPADSVGIRTALALVIVGAGALALATIGRSVYLSRGGQRTHEIWLLTQEAHRAEHFAGAVLIIIAVVAAAVSFVWPWAVIVALIAALAVQFVQWRLFFVTGIPLNWKAEVKWSRPQSAAGREV